MDNQNNQGGNPNEQQGGAPEEPKKEHEQEPKQQAQPEEQAAPAPEQQQAGGEAPAGDAPQQADPKDVEENKAISYLSYLGILFLIPMLAKRDSKFAQFHSKQGLVLTIGWFLGSFLIPVFGLGGLVYLVIIVFSIMGLVNVSNGEMKDLPVAGDIAKKFNI